MLPPIPLEIFDFIVDHLHDDPTALKSCCLVSKSWVPRARRYLFAQVEFTSHRCPIQSWINAFPDPSNSPGHHTRSLNLYDIKSTNAAGTIAPTWVHHFSQIEELTVANFMSRNLLPVSFVQLRGLSPTLKSLHIFHVSARLSEFFDLICSFPLLENLSLHFITTWGDADRWYTPPTSPKLTGSLHLIDPSPLVTRELLAFPIGPRFSQIAVSCPVESAKLVADLISKCSDTLEYLTVGFDYPTPGLLDLSEAIKLKEMRFESVGLDVRWVITALRTAKSANLQNIMIKIGSSRSTLVKTIGETLHREWEDLDHLLDQLWTSRSIRPKVTYELRRAANGLGELVQSFLPKLASKGVINGV
ncbi:hypothetical protein BJ322DRAFT_1112217 [Thelephora terrestris]|uniref:F-box domain-containing protein n=1 Tax=Thelephora terrestris TaxID=56493 RepID=A0A9P6L2T1_9AGAM|nr:hypothetical protein BJ322DRAFT_1112217 [Thelephora terrestris]